ncbi:LysR family transcriptional regulator [Nocardiopsis sp. NPDC101807]|uniref:LysR family transcriptional regulator n=1 Tax=Nocardiopsis sp. NPDC101807 TaxID=3364339 RepID=UPI003820FECD
MDLGRHLRYFLVVAREGHFGEAAVELGIAQPALSQSVRRLEEELGVTLFDRSRRRVSLTPAGRLLVSQARDLVAGEARLRETMRRTRDGELGTLRAAVRPGTPATALRGLLRGMAEHAPGLDVDLCEMTGAELVRALGEGTVDTGLLTTPFEGSGLLGEPVLREELGAVLPRAEAPPHSAPVALADLSGRELVLSARRSDPAWFEHVLSVCREHGWTPPRVREAGDAGFLLGLVLAGLGVGLESARVAAREPRLAWRPLEGAPLLRSTEAVRPARDAHPAAPAFAEVAARVLAEHPRGSLAEPHGERPWSLVYGGRSLTRPR